ncbi:MAG: alpha/beta hydrolase-fold protein [Ignavibacteriota bacterium]
MKKLFILLILLSAVDFIYPQNQFQQFIFHVNSITDPGLKASAVDSFMIYARTQGIPFITGDSANFMYRGSVSSISVAGDFNSWSADSSMININQTNFWFYSKRFELDARLDYKFVTNGSNWILDPENPNMVSGGFGPNSELAMPEYIQPWEINYNSSISHGTLLNKIIFSSYLNANYQLKIYLPLGYDSLSLERYPTVYFQDGFEYVSLASAPNVIDNLIDSNKIKSVIAVFVRPNNRNDEYAGNKRLQYRNFFINELVPYIDQNCKTKVLASDRLVLGDSYGGNISAIISYNHPDLFGNCGLHSGAFQPNGYEIYSQIMTDLANGITKNIKWYSTWGTYEGSLTGTMNSFKDSLLIHNYEMGWMEKHEGHSWGLWRATIDDILVYFFPYYPTAVNDEVHNIPQQFELKQNYPNPFNPSTKISWQSPIGSWQTLKVYDILGNEIVTLVNEYRNAGSYEVDFNIPLTNYHLSSGVYFYRLQIGSLERTKKMLLLK